MRRQQKIWEEKHRKAAAWPSLANEKAQSGVVLFVKYIKKQLTPQSSKPPLRCVDIGCGKGRNAIYLAQQGFDVYAMDYVKEALDSTRKRAASSGIAQKIKPLKAPIDKKWPFRNNFFDVAVDCFSSIDIETEKGRIVYKKEMLRTLKPGGRALVMVVSADDEIEAELMKTSPGPEKNSTIWPANGKFQKDYDESGLREFYSEFDIVRLKKIRKKAFKLGKGYTATNYWVVLRKPFK